MFTGNYTITAAAGKNVSVLADTSSFASEAKNTFTGRRITLTTSTGTTLVPSGTTTSYINFPFSGGDSITINIPMNRDYDLYVKVDWLPITPVGGSTYTLTRLYGFTDYNYEAEYNDIIKAMTGQPNIIHAPQYLTSLAKIQCERVTNEQAVSYLQQEYGQASLDRAAYILTNQQNNF